MTLPLVCAAEGARHDSTTLVLFNTRLSTPEGGAEGTVGRKGREGFMYCEVFEGEIISGSLFPKKALKGGREGREVNQ